MTFVIICYHTDHSLSLLVTLPGGRTIDQPLYGAAWLEIQQHYHLEIVETHETYDIITLIPITPAPAPEKEIEK